MKRRIPVIALVCLFVLCIAGTGPVMKTQAASEFNLVESVSKKKVRSGYWKKNSRGWWYQYFNGKYPKNKWLKINGQIYYFNKKGYMVTGKKSYKGKIYFLRTSKQLKGALLTGWKVIKSKRYYFSTETGAAVTGWQTIGGEKYHFNGKGVMSKNCTVDGVKLDSKGREIISKGNASISTSPNPSTKSELIFVGDSRTVGLGQVIGGSPKYIGKIGEGYEWLIRKAVKELEKELQEYPASSVVLNFGINDLGNITNYILYYQSLFAKYPDAAFHVVSIHPIEQKLAKRAGYCVTNEQIELFNTQMRAAFPGNFIDTYSYLMNQNYIVSKGKSTVDGVHYTAAGYQAIYNYIMTQI